MSEEKREECGIVGIISKKKNAAEMLYKAMMTLQHRGQDACGMALVTENGIKLIRDIGLVSEVIKEEHLKIEASVGIAHTRYPTAGECFLCDVQPLVERDIAVAHNGQISNYLSMRKELVKEGEKFESSGDSEVLLKILGKHKKDIAKGVVEIAEKLDGSYSVVALVGRRLLAFRDSNEFRPLVYGQTSETFCFASESVALDINEIPYLGSLGGGKASFAELSGDRIHVTTIPIAKEKKRTTHCMFEYVYFSRPDSIINDHSVLEARRRLGEQLAKEHPAKAEVVIPVPDTSRTAAKAFATSLGIEFEEGFIKNRYIGRTFIMSTQNKRSESVRLKLNPIKEVINGEKVVLVDDSIVRGTTLREIVRLVKRAGAKEVHVRITCPPIKAPCYYGVDMKTYAELIANNKSIEEIRNFLEVETLGYLSIQGLKKAIYDGLCTGCLNEDYPTTYGQQKAKERITLVGVK